MLPADRERLARLIALGWREHGQSQGSSPETWRGISSRRRNENNIQGEGPETQAEEPEAIDLGRSDEEKEEAPEGAKRARE